MILLPTAKCFIHFFAFGYRFQVSTYSIQFLTALSFISNIFFEVHVL